MDKRGSVITYTELAVRYQETDKMGIVHHSVYPIWFECGRTDWIKNAGMTYAEMEKEGLLLPLLSLQCRYKAPAEYGDCVTVVTSVKKATLSRINFFYKVYKNGDKDKVIALGETEHAWVNKDMRPVNFKKSFPHIFGKLKGFLQLDR